MNEQELRAALDDLSERVDHLEELIRDLLSEQTFTISPYMLDGEAVDVPWEY